MARQLTDFENLLKIHVVKASDREENSIRQFLAVAQSHLTDAPNASAAGRFLLAYEGIHSVAMAVLLHFGARPGEGEGHRISALQIAAQELKLDEIKPGSFKFLTGLNQKRNNKTYREPLPPVTEKDANACVELLGLILREAQKLVDTKDDMAQ